MRGNSRRRSAISPLTQKVKAPQHLLRLREDEGDDGRDDEWDDRFRLPSLPRQKSWRDDDVPSNGDSAATSVSWSQEVEGVATQRLEEQWATVERTLHEEGDQLLQEPALDECIQWRTQVPFLRVVGRNATACNGDRKQRDVGSGDKRTRRLEPRGDELFGDRSLLAKEGEDSVQYKLNRAKFEDVLDMMMEHVISELFPGEKSDTDSPRDDLSDALRIAPAPVHGNRNSSRNSSSRKANWTEEAISPNYIENKSISIRNRLLDTESSLQTIKNDANRQGVQKRNSISANKPRNLDDTADDDVLRSEECTPHIGRNKLGTVFNERIVVSPVPFTVSTRESFSTLKMVPIKFMNENLEISSRQGSARYTGFQGSARKSGALRNPNVHSAWQTPVSPTVWPKNIRLAPIDTSRLPSSKNNGSLAPSPALLHCNRKPLSPISRSAIPKSAHATRDRSGDFLAIQGKHIVPAQSKISLLSAGWDCSPRVARGKKKKARAKERL
ncbi:PREDICTED: uncharacterized protein LOC105555798 [Vollenhovia emeryi]|uniref:uncharacterized protein LOC105555798 n=1 Tax=Vollenhovia emeryi TaxID=411798 RepID=UPI0005F54839|nr:PREDICTED: uncharacterized protein LOC105555798 [Vollenhovia emeryi]XP_011858230.1 PREDICTED: uncharacterized protein LOC105555798 [Vollenhovia emeryi]